MPETLREVRCWKCQKLLARQDIRDGFLQIVCRCKATTEVNAAPVR